MAIPNATTRVFAIPELLELILLSLPCDTTHQEISTTRFILLSRTTCSTWHHLVTTSTPLRQNLYLPTPLDFSLSIAYNEKACFPPARPNPWIPHLLLNQRSWGSAYPFDNAYSAYNLHPSEPKHWTFSFEVSRTQYSRFPPAGPWREMLASSPPFTEFWYTRSFYELGSGRAPFVTHLDYDPGLPKLGQKYRKHCSGGVTLGMVVDAVCELIEKDSSAKFVMVESLRMIEEDESQTCTTKLEDDRPTTRGYLPGSSAEREWGWQREQYQH